MMMTLKQPDSEWVPSIDLFTLLENSKSWEFFLKQSNHCLETTTGDTNTLLLWLFLKSVSTLTNLRKFHQSYKWLSDLWEMQIQCSGTQHAMRLGKYLTICNQNSNKCTETVCFQSWLIFWMMQSQELSRTPQLHWPISSREWNGNRFKKAFRKWWVFCLSIPTMAFLWSKKAVWAQSHQLLKLLKRISNHFCKTPFFWCLASSKTKNTKQKSTNNWKANLSKLWPSSPVQLEEKCSNQSLKNLLIWWSTCNNLNSNKQTLKRLTFWLAGKDFALFTERNWLATWIEFFLHCLPWLKTSSILNWNSSTIPLKALNRKNKVKTIWTISTLLKLNKPKLPFRCLTSSSNN